MAGRGGRGVWVLLLALLSAGCGGSSDPASGAAPSGGSGSRRVIFVGFDASEPLVDAMRQGKIQGLVVQNPLRMGKLSVETMVKHLEKQAGRAPGLDR